MVKSPLLNGEKIAGQWTVTSFPLKDDSLENLPFEKSENKSLPSFFRSNLVINEEPMDTFVEMVGWGKGVIFVNGKNLGRYWKTAGPQETLYLPGSCTLKMISKRTRLK